jgi:hypothetical protein
LTGIDAELVKRDSFRGAATVADPYATGRRHMSRAQALCGRWLISNLMGLSVGGWLALLSDNQFAIGPRYWSRAVVITLLSLFNSTAGLIERVRFGPAIAAARPVAPIFILGHWRSGTTLLHNLLALDARFAAPNLFETMFPNGFMVTERWQAGLWSRLVPDTRLIDNMKLGTDMPQEDELALAILTRHSPYMGHSFPRRWAHYMRYLDFRDVEPAERKEWQRGLLDFMRKLTVHRNGKTLLLKSPPHTARIPMLLELFPDARFIHIHRNPYRVFQSNLHMLTEGLPLAKMQSGDLPAPEDFVIERYNRLHDAYFADRGLIPAGHLIDVRFEDLAADPVGTLERVYRALDLGPIDPIRPALEAERDRLRDYVQNRYRPLADATRQRLTREWRRSFETWGYDPEP